jgi:hypothetical protein
MVPQLGQGFLQPNGREATGEPQRWQAGLSSRANARDLAGGGTLSLTPARSR